ncbi:hypothetical protein [Microbacterium hominis]|uniref:Uncharacterized protein n=1 Tax=Microbacterium hominis TaxID=162426 RepID=A0A7D4PT52_9MICO|nr:hypothetical protein [Microbacterium hominis]QKJ18553.1 hypothetical protein HQM25_03570 [Microbacterium hominis]
MSQDAATAVRRPVVLTVAIVLVYLNALAQVLTGILVLLSRYDVEPSIVLPVSLLGSAIILFGLLVLAVASGVGRGSALSRILLTVYIGALLALSAVTIILADTWDASSAVNVAVEAFILVALWLPPVSRFMGARSAAGQAAPAG